MTIKVPPRLCRPVPSSKSTASRPTWWWGHRDSLLGLEPTDWDIATDAVPDQVEELFPGSLLPEEVWYGNRLYGRQRPEVTTMRRRILYDQRRPDYIIFTDRLELDRQARFHHQRLGYTPGPAPHRSLSRAQTLGESRHTVGELTTVFGRPLVHAAFLRFQATLGFRSRKRPNRSCRSWHLS